MDEQERRALAVEGQRAQTGLTFGETVEMLKNEGRPGTSIQDGLELLGNGVDDEPREMEEVDPGWQGFQQRVQDAEDEGWLAAAAAGERAAVAQAHTVYQTSYDDTELLKATLNLVTNAPPERYQEFLATINEDDPDTARALAQTVSNTLNEMSAMEQERSFQQYMVESEQLNAADVAATLDDVAAKRGISDQDMELAARAFMQATGKPLRLALSATMPGEERETLAYEVAVAAAVDERAERERAFKASFFSGGTDISSGLVVNGVRQAGDLPPTITDPAYNAWKVEQSIRRQDSERATRPAPDQSAYEVKQQMLGPEGRDINAGLTDANGRPTSFQKIAENDPNSALNVQKRAREAELAKISAYTGARRT